MIFSVIGPDSTLVGFRLWSLSNSSNHLPISPFTSFLYHLILLKYYSTPPFASSISSYRKTSFGVSDIMGTTCTSTDTISACLGGESSSDCLIEVYEMWGDFSPPWLPQCVLSSWGGRSVCWKSLVFKVLLGIRSTLILLGVGGY